MQEQEKKDETPKIIVMVVLILLCLGVVFWRILGAKSQQTVQASAPTPPPATTTMIASAANGPNVAHPSDVVGAERDFTPLDEDQGGQTTPSTSSKVFVTPAAAKQIPAPPIPTARTHPPVAGQADPWGTATTPLPPRLPEPPLTHPVDIKIEGIVTGPDGFAMITEGDQTAFKRVGDNYTANYRILRLSENWVTVQHKIVTIEHNHKVAHLVKEVWQPGDKIKIQAPGGIPGANPNQPFLRPMTVPGPSSNLDTLPPMSATSDAAESAAKHKSSNVTLPVSPAALR